jgi:hypothetical protein
MWLVTDIWRVEGRAMTGEDWKLLVSVAVPLATLLLGFGLSQLTERVKWSRQREADDLRWQREQAVRHSRDRLEAYAAYSRFSDALGYLLLERRKGRKEPTVMGYNFDRVVEEFSRAQELVALLAPSEVRQYLPRVDEVIAALADFAGPQQLPDAYEALAARLSQVRKDLIEAARLEWAQDPPTTPAAR